MMGPSLITGTFALKNFCSREVKVPYMSASTLCGIGRPIVRNRRRNKVTD